MSTTKVKIGLLENRLTEAVAISTLTGTVNFDCESGSVFKLSGDITAGMKKIVNG